MTASPNYSVAVGPNQDLTDSQGNIWWISNSGQITEAQLAPDGVTLINITVDQLTNNVEALAIVNGTIWQQAQNASNWWEKTNQGYDGWGTMTNQSPLPPSPSGSILVAPGNVNAVYPQNPLSALVDNQGNLWWIANGQVVENGNVDALTNNVTEMAFKDGSIYQQGTGGEWWQKTNQGYDGWGTPGTADGHVVTPPVAVKLTWVGGGNNQASNPADWSPAGQPQAGDHLTMNSGVMNIGSDALENDLLNMTGGDDTLNVYGPAAHFSITNGDPGTPGGGPDTVNLAANTVWVGGFTDAGPYGGPTTIQGAGEMDNTTSMIDNVVTVNAIVAGAGAWTTEQAHGPGTKLEFMQSVSDQQTVNIQGGGYGNIGSVVQVDAPASYKATTELGFGEMIVKGATADSYSYSNDMLSLYRGDTVVDALKLGMLTNNEGMYSPVGATNFGVSAIAGGIDVHADGSAYHGGGTLLPLHT